MPVPAPVSQWLSRVYPKPKVDQEWLVGCYEWLSQELNIVNPTDRMEEIIANVEEHLLRSNFRDSMVPGTGFPANVSEIEKARLAGPPILVEIVQMTEIGHSAFNLMSVWQTRVDKADLAGLERGDEDEDRYEDPEDDGPIPKYPRSMLKFMLSDGYITIPAIEYRKLPELILGETPPGCKLLLKNVSIRRGMAFLEPESVEIKGYGTEERVANQERDFLAGLRMRMGLPAEDPNDAQEQERHSPGPQPPVHAMVPPRVPTPEPPPPETLDDMVVIDIDDIEDNDDKENIPLISYRPLRNLSPPPSSQADVIYISD